MRGGRVPKYEYLELLKGKKRTPKFNSFTDIAAEYGWTKGVVAGMFRRHKTEKVVIKGHTFIKQRIENERTKTDPER